MAWQHYRIRIRSLLLMILVVGIALASVRTGLRYAKYHRIWTQARNLTNDNSELKEQVAIRDRKSTLVRPGTLRDRLIRQDLNGLKDMSVQVDRRLRDLDQDARKVWGPLF